MKKIILLNIAFVIWGLGISMASENIVSIKSENKVSLIDASDTVVFDLSNATLTGNSWSFPVLILSDDTVNALDFSFKYNHSKLSYDSISDLTNYIQPLAFYNPNDSTVRFTSNSFQRYSNNTALVKIHFTLLSGQLDSTDLYSIKVYLNGNVCSLYQNSLISTSVETVQDKVRSFSVFPNPAKDDFFVTNLFPQAHSTLHITNEQGQLIYKAEVVEKTMHINTRMIALSGGLYTIHLSSGKQQFTQKIVITK
jgi:hypothetical protein